MSRGCREFEVVTARGIGQKNDPSCLCFSLVEVGVTFAASSAHIGLSLRRSELVLEGVLFVRVGQEGHGFFEDKQNLSAARGFRKPGHGFDYTQKGMQ